MSDTFEFLQTSLLRIPRTKKMLKAEYSVLNDQIDLIWTHTETWLSWEVRKAEKVEERRERATSSKEIRADYT